MKRLEPVNALIDIELMKCLLDAALATAKMRRNTPEELFSLGQAESMANAFYVMIMTQGFESLEDHCQRVAAEVHDRVAEIMGRQRQMPGRVPAARPFLAVVG